MGRLGLGFYLPLFEEPESGEKTTWTRIKSMAQTAESFGFDTVWLADELLWRVPDCRQTSSPRTSTGAGLCPHTGASPKTTSICSRIRTSTTQEGPVSGIREGLTSGTIRTCWWPSLVGVMPSVEPTT